VSVSAPPPKLASQERALIEELHQLTATLAPRLWPQWPGRLPPILLRARGLDILIAHPDPPHEFSPLLQAGLPWPASVRAAAGQPDVQASYPINGVATAVMSPPTPGESPCAWVLKAAHEVFHCYQGIDRIRDPFVGRFSSYNDLTFPFPYADEARSAAFRLEAEIIYRLATAEPGDAAALATDSRLLLLAWRVERALPGGPELQDYKLLTEWSEGVARYTERELARLAATYRPATSFATAFPACSYEQVYRDRYGPTTMLNPIRFVGQGVSGRTMFYYLGMGKAYALDRMDPDWKRGYRRATLDELLERAASSLEK
jgi:hypothetical protein